MYSTPEVWSNIGTCTMEQQANRPEFVYTPSHSTKIAQSAALSSYRNPRKLESDWYAVWNLILQKLAMVMPEGHLIVYPHQDLSVPGIFVQQYTLQDTWESQLQAASEGVNLTAPDPTGTGRAHSSNMDDNGGVANRYASS